MDQSLEMRLQESEQRYRLLHQNFIDTIWVMDIESGKFTYYSPSAKHDRGYSMEEILSVPVRRQLSAESYENMERLLDIEVSRYDQGEHRPVRADLEILRNDGSAIWVECSIRLVNDGKLKAMGISRDITIRKNLEQERDELAGRLDEALETQARLLKELKVLEGLLPICANCKKIRDENGQWVELEEYIRTRSEADFTHSICPDCSKILYNR